MHNRVDGDGLSRGNHATWVAGASASRWHGPGSPQGSPAPAAGCEGLQESLVLAACSASPNSRLGSALALVPPSEVRPGRSQTHLSAAHRKCSNSAKGQPRRQALSGAASGGNMAATADGGRLTIRVVGAEPKPTDWWLRVLHKVPGAECLTHVYGLVEPVLHPHTLPTAASCPPALPRSACTRPAWRCKRRWRSSSLSSQPRSWPARRDPMAWRGSASSAAPRRQTSAPTCEASPARRHGGGWCQLLRARPGPRGGGSRASRATLHFHLDPLVQVPAVCDPTAVHPAGGHLPQLLHVQPAAPRARVLRRLRPGRMDLVSSRAFIPPRQLAHALHESPLPAWFGLPRIAALQRRRRPRQPPACTHRHRAARRAQVVRGGGRGHCRRVLRPPARVQRRAGGAGGPGGVALAAGAGVCSHGGSQRHARAVQVRCGAAACRTAGACAAAAPSPSRQAHSSRPCVPGATRPTPGAGAARRTTLRIANSSASRATPPRRGATSPRPSGPQAASRGSSRCLAASWRCSWRGRRAAANSAS